MTKISITNFEKGVQDIFHHLKKNRLGIGMLLGFLKDHFWG